jgi:hypothetical protein
VPVYSSFTCLTVKLPYKATSGDLFRFNEPSEILFMALGLNKCPQLFLSPVALPAYTNICDRNCVAAWGAGPRSVNRKVLIASQSPKSTFLLLFFIIRYL